MTTARSVLRGAGAYARTLATGAAVLSLVMALVTVRDRGAPVRSNDAAKALAKGNGAAVDASTNAASPETSAAAQASAYGAGESARRAAARGAGTASFPRAGTVIPGKGTVPFGVTDKEILLVYYWKGDRTMTSPYLHGSGQEGNVDEGEAFNALIDYVNKYANGGGTLMGFPFKLHGRRLTGKVLEAGQYPDTYAATARDIEQKYKPFAAISSHGSLSAYICPDLAKAGILNVSTYDLAGDLVRKTKGFCMPSGMSWDRQVEYTIAYLKKHAATTKYQGAVEEPRRYGFLYTEYPPLLGSAPIVIDQLKKAGVPIVETATLVTDLASAQQQVPLVVAKFRAANVNTLIIPDAGTPLNFTHGAQANGYNPDYFVWPCSGTDNSGMVRLYNAAQWTRAKGLTCYDENFNADLTNDDIARSSEWYRQYQEVRPGAEPPAPTSIVAQSLVQVLVGITNAGRDLTLETFRAGLDALKPYRYHAIKGAVNDPKSILISFNEPDRSPLGDVARVDWSSTARKSGSATQGAYVYPEDRRYARGGSF